MTTPHTEASKFDTARRAATGGSPPGPCDPPSARRIGPALALALLLAAATAPRASVAQDAADAGTLVSAAEALRRDTCAPPPAARGALQRRAVLDRAARLFAGGLPLGEALQRAGYLATQSAGVSLGGVRDSATLRRLLLREFCGRLASGELSEVGAWRDGERGWLIVATPPQPAGPAGDVQQSLVSGAEPPAPERGRRQVLELVNAARAAPRRSGTQSFGASPPLRESAALRLAAERHAADMARRAYFDHVGRDGSSPQERISRAGYAWSISGENLALGRMSAAEAVAGWLASPGHCANIMDPRFTESGVALATGRGAERATYWVQTFGAPRKTR